MLPYNAVQGKLRYGSYRFPVQITHLTWSLQVCKGPAKTPLPCTDTPWKATSTSRVLFPRLLQNWLRVISSVAAGVSLKCMTWRAWAPRLTKARASVSLYRVEGRIWVARNMKFLQPTSSSALEEVKKTFLHTVLFFSTLVFDTHIKFLVSHLVFHENKFLFVAGSAYRVPWTACRSGPL